MAVKCGICYKELKGKQNAGSDKVPMCKTCFERGFFKCSECGEVRAKSDTRHRPGDHGHDSPVCRYCAEDNGW